LYIHKGIFNEIIHIKDTRNKKEFITHKPALFIDDSFIERSNTASDNIYTFDVDSHEIIRDIIRISNRQHCIQ